MKINRLRFENINSLAGKWEIDFTDPAFADGIFILAGPTGAGKTSILDALCLGLYGETSRQHSFTSQVNEVMTKGMTRCFSEVEFESQGRQYRARWEHGIKKGGRFQDRVSRKIWDISGGDDLIAETITDAGMEIFRILKMDFKQFTSAVLLPQGKFDEFLSADKKVRSEILEKITGARIYSQIGAAVQERKSEEERKLKSLNEAKTAIRILGAEEEAAMRSELGEQKNRAAEKNLAVLEHTRYLEQRRHFEKLRNEEQSLAEELLRLRNEEKAHADDFAGLERAKAAAGLFSLVNGFEQSEKERITLTLETESTTAALAALAAEETELARQLAAAETALENTRQYHDAALPLLKKMRELSAAAEGTQKDINRTDEACRATEEERAASARSLEKETVNLAALAAERAGLEKELSAAEGDREKLCGTTEKLREQISELSVFSSALSFDESRKKLLPGTICPLCGSTDHPFCNDTAHFEEQQKRFTRYSEEKAAVEQELSAKERAVESLKERKTAAEKKYAVGEERRNAAAALLARLEESARSLAAEGETLRQDMARHSAEFKETAARLVAAIPDTPGAQTGKAALTSEAIEVPQLQSIEQYEEELNRALKQAEAGYTGLCKKAGELSASRGVHEEHLAKDRALKETLEAEAETKRAAMEKGFARGGFAGIDEWRSCYWETERIVKVQRTQTSLSTLIDTTTAGLETKQKERSDFQAEFQAGSQTKNPPFPPDEPERIEEIISTLQSELQRLDQSTLELGVKLAENENKKKERAELEQDIASRTESCRRWKRMDEWIGGKDGFRFKQFAQGITFEQLVYNSAPHLLKMSSGRYELLADRDNDALLPVVNDRHQGSVERVISNLSGGERFLLSLSLALGLSKLNSRNLQIDSLFLDEGFGTLDKETLELAITILSGLQQGEGKLLGIISHVEELQERIAAVIRVSKRGGGRSAISGCGVNTCV